MHGTPALPDFNKVELYFSCFLRCVLACSVAICFFIITERTLHKQIIKKFTFLDTLETKLNSPIYLRYVSLAHQDAESAWHEGQAALTVAFGLWLEKYSRQNFHKKISEAASLRERRFYSLSMHPAPLGGDSLSMSCVALISDGDALGTGEPNIIAEAQYNCLALDAWVASAHFGEFFGDPIAHSSSSRNKIVQVLRSVGRDAFRKFIYSNIL